MYKARERIHHGVLITVLIPASCRRGLAYNQAELALNCLPSTPLVVPAIVARVGHKGHDDLTSSRFLRLPAVSLTIRVALVAGQPSRHELTATMHHLSL